METRLAPDALRVRRTSAPSTRCNCPAGPPVSRHVEHRIAGADANLYLAVAAVLGAAAQGMARKSEPGLPVDGNGYAQAGERTMPGSWREALAAAENSQFLRDTLGVEFMKIFLAIKHQECARFTAEVSELDYAWYLRS